MPDPYQKQDLKLTNLALPEMNLIRSPIPQASINNIPK